MILRILFALFALGALGALLYLQQEGNKATATGLERRVERGAQDLPQYARN